MAAFGLILDVVCVVRVSFHTELGTVPLEQALKHAETEVDRLTVPLYPALLSR